MPGRSFALEVDRSGRAWLFALCSATAGLQTGEDPRTALRFLKDLRDHGLHDMAL